jgi:hypothetical protein
LNRLDARAVKKPSLDKLTVTELVDRFAAICVEQDKALFEDEIAKFNVYTIKWRPSKKN